MKPCTHASVAGCRPYTSAQQCLISWLVAGCGSRSRGDLLPKQIVKTNMFFCDDTIDPHLQRARIIAMRYDENDPFTRLRCKGLLPAKSQTAPFSLMADGGCCGGRMLLFEHFAKRPTTRHDESIGILRSVLPRPLSVPMVLR